jgi:hypothetical protein
MNFTRNATCDILNSSLLIPTFNFNSPIGQDYHAAVFTADFLQCSLQGPALFSSIAACVLGFSIFMTDFLEIFRCRVKTQHKPLVIVSYFIALLADASLFLTMGSWIQSD